MDAPTPIIEGTHPPSPGIAAMCVSKESSIRPILAIASKVPIQNAFHQLRLTLLLEASYYVQKSCYMLQFHKILLHTHKFLQHTLYRKTWYFRPWIYREAYSFCRSSRPPTGALPLDPLTCPPNVRHKSPPLQIWTWVGSIHRFYVLAWVRDCIL